MPVFFPTGSDAQLIFGLCVCFLTFGVYMLLNPFEEIGEDRLAQLCQMQIFFSLVLSLALRSAQRANSTNEVFGLDVLLTVLTRATHTGPQPQCTPAHGPPRL